jgi:uncharacterized SAM-binding protein YcdF (DUF218 family)
MSLRWLVRALAAPLAVRHAHETAQAIVILGAPPHPDGTPAPLLAERIRTGAALYHRGLAPLVFVTGGRGPGALHVATEADVMGRELLALGVPAHALSLEHTATNTADNARRAAELLHPLGIRRVWLVTQPFHLRRALFWFRVVGFDPLGWRIEDSVIYTSAGRGLLMVVREYLAWLRAGLHEIKVRSFRDQT